MLRSKIPYGDKYALSRLGVGQSRRVEHGSLLALQAACSKAKQRGFGRFTADFDNAGDLRVWRVE